MAHVRILVLVAGAVAMSGGIAAGQSMSSRICAAATESFGDTPLPLGSSADVLLASSSLSNPSPWAPLTQWSPNPVSQNVSTLYVAYIHNAHTYEPAGAVSIKISVAKDPTSRSTPYVEVHRPAIERGTNRCEPRGRRAVEQQVRINEYIDHHARSGNSTVLESFHFQYPYSVNQCAYTNRSDGVAETYQFPDIHRTTGDTFVARNFSLLTPGQAQPPNDVSSLRSEIHYYNRSNSAACAGFQVSLYGISKKASVLIHDLSSNWFTPRGTWSIVRQ